MFFNKILIAMDDSAPSQYAIEAGLNIAADDKAAVIFAVALDPCLLSSDCSFGSVRELAEHVAEEIVSAAMQRARERGVEATSHILFEHAARAIITRAQSEGVGLIVMGTHGRRGIARALGRSIAEEVLRNTNTPLCVVRQPAIGIIYRCLLVPVVDDDLSDMTVRYAIELGRAFHCEVIFCTIEAPRTSGDINAFLQGAMQRAQESGVHGRSVVIPKSGTIARCILKQVHVDGVDAIVMSSHARDGLSRLVEGSVAESVIRRSTTPVIVLRRNGATI